MFFSSLSWHTQTVFIFDYFFFIEKHVIEIYWTEPIFICTFSFILNGTSCCYLLIGLSWSSFRFHDLYWEHIYVLYSQSKKHCVLLLYVTIWNTERRHTFTLSEVIADFLCSIDHWLFAVLPVLIVHIEFIYSILCRIHPPSSPVRQVLTHFSVYL